MFSSTRIGGTLVPSALEVVPYHLRLLFFLLFFFWYFCCRKQILMTRIVKILMEGFSGVVIGDCLGVFWCVCVCGFFGARGRRSVICQGILILAVFVYYCSILEFFCRRMKNFYFYFCVLHFVLPLKRRGFLRRQGAGDCKEQMKSKY